MRKSLVLAVAALSTAGIAALVPTAANAACTAASATGNSCTTTLTVTLTGGTLSVAAPATASMAGSSNTASIVTGTVAGNSVTDNRGSLLGWTVQATATDLTSASSHTITLGATGPLAVVGANLSAGAGGILGVGLKPALAAAGFLSSTATPVITAPATVGGGTYNYDMSLTLTVPANTYADTYTSTITQTVA